MLILPRRKFLLGASALIAAPAIVRAQSLGFPPGMFSGRGAIDASAGGGAPTWTKTAAPAIQNLAYGPSTATFSSVAIGTASSSRIVIVFVAANYAATTTAITCTIGGNAATLAVANSYSGTGPTDLIFYLAVPSGTTATIVLTVAATPSPAFGYVGITVGALTGVTATPTSTATQNSQYAADPQVTTSALTVPATGFGLVVGAGGGSTATWNVGTEDYMVNSAGLNITSGYISASGSQTPSISGFSFAFFGMVAATWGP